MEGVRMMYFLLMLLMSLFNSFAQGERRPILRSGDQGECKEEEVELSRLGTEQWLVSAGHTWPGIADGTQNTCRWKVKAPPGHGVMVEFVQLRVRRSRRCSAARLEVVAAGSVTRTHRTTSRPLARFCGRIPKTKVWRTTFSEVDIEYRKGKGRGRPSYRPQQGSDTSSSSDSTVNQAALDRAERLKRIKTLHELYKKKTRQNKPSSSTRDLQRHNTRRFYRHLTDEHDSADDSGFIGDDDLVLDGHRFVYDRESDAYGTRTIIDPHFKMGVRFVSVGQPAWFNSSSVVRLGVTVEGEPDEHYYEDSEYLNLHPKLNTSHGNQNDNELLANESEPEDKHTRVTRDTGYERSQKQRPQRQRSLQYRNKHLVSSSLRQHQGHPSSLRTLHSDRSRSHNEIVPRKPFKTPHHGRSQERKHRQYNNNRISLQTYNTHPNRLGGGRRKVKGEYFVLKVSAYQTGCGGTHEAASGWFSNTEYPRKTNEKGSCLWRFKTPARSHWKLTCKDFLIRRSRDCRRDHLAIKINNSPWSRYCGRQGPSLALTSSHPATVDVVLNTFRNRSARVMCSWETSHNIDRSSRFHQTYDSYWSYNLTVATTTTTTTTTTTPPPPQVVHQSSRRRGCGEYQHLTPDHTMCKSTPSSCDIYRDGVQSVDKVAILAAHNKYRAKVARGEEGEGLPGPQYSASNMHELTWNDELAHVAQAWAAACPDYHDCHDCRKLVSRNYYVGQNIFYEWSSTNAGSVWDTAIRLWYEEVKYVPNYLTKRFVSMDHAVIGHYTQLVWGETREVGCGAVYHNCDKVFKGKSWNLKCKIYVCNYGPTGNYLDKPMYTIGPPASECPSGSRPSQRYPGLCTSH